MTMRTRIEPGDRVPLRLSLEDRDLILEHAFLDDETVQPLRAASVEGAAIVVRYTLEDLDEISGAVAAEANHAKSKKLGTQLDAVWRKITDTLQSYDDGLFNDSPPR